jgi:hypothetical protein
MTDSTNNQPASKTPSHIAYHVRNREGGEGFWTRIPLHCTAANDPLRWLTLSFRCIPTLELRRQAGGYATFMSHAVAMSHASCARVADSVGK